MLNRASTRANQGGRGHCVRPSSAPLTCGEFSPCLTTGKPGTLRGVPDCSSVNRELYQMFAIMMGKGLKVTRIFLMDDSIAKQGFDVTGEIKRPNILISAAQDHLDLLQDELDRRKQHDE